MLWAVNSSKGGGWRWGEVDADGGFVACEWFEKRRINRKRDKTYVIKGRFL